MRKSLSLLAFVVIGAAMMYGQASRTWVSGVGDDANPCSRTAPCKTFAGAISKTAPGGEIDALDPAGYGAVTITKAITIDGGGAQVASVLVAGTNGIVVQAGPNDVVILRNLRINGISGSGNGGFNGIRFLAGKDLNVESCYIFGFTQNGIDISLNQGTQATAHIINTVLKNNGGVGVRATNAVAPAVKVGINETSVMLSGSHGVEASTNSRISVDHGFISASSGSGVLADGSGSAPSGVVTVDYSDLVNGHNGATATANNTVFISHTTITGNDGTA